MSKTNKQRRPMLAENDFKIHRATVIAAAAMVMLLLVPGSLFAGDSIVGVHENGRMIFVNNEASVMPPDGVSNTPTVHKRVVYWSNVEHRWKRVPMTSAAARSARYAAQEVSAALNVPATNPSVEQSAAAVQTPEISSVPAAKKISQQSIDAAIDAAAKRHNIDANLVRAMIQVESNFNPRAVSRKGAMGLMQLMPSTARQLNVKNPFDPNQNVDGGVRHLKLLLDNYGGDVQLSLAAYNAGSGAVARNGGVPPYAETRGYVKKITKLYGGNSTMTAERMSHSIRSSRDSEGHLLFSNE